MKKLFELFITFAKIGLFTFGGGYAMIAIIEDECVEKKQWITAEDMMNVTVIAESTPGPIAINCATFVGFKQKGLLGAIFATLGMIVPSLVIILIIAAFLDRFLEIKWVANAFSGIKVAVAIIIIDAALKLKKKLKEKGTLFWFIFIVSYILMLLIDIFAWNISSIILMLASALIGLSVFAASKLIKKGVARK